MIEIILLAMVAAFVGLRLYSVLGRRTGHEQPIAKPLDGKLAAASPLRPVGAQRGAAPAGAEALIEPPAADGVRAIVSADPSFDAASFIEGARSAYRMVLDAYWTGNEAELGRLTGDEVRETFVAAIAQRAAAGERLDNTLVSIDRAVIAAAGMDGQMAVVTVRFDADIVAVTRAADGEIVAGSDSDAVPTQDVWTFSRHARADDPNWVLIETDEAA